MSSTKKPISCAGFRDCQICNPLWICNPMHGARQREQLRWNSKDRRRNENATRSTHLSIAKHVCRGHTAEELKSIIRRVANTRNPDGTGAHGRRITQSGNIDMVRNLHSSYSQVIALETTACEDGFIYFMIVPPIGYKWFILLNRVDSLD
jgi:hypothetical protein